MSDLEDDVLMAFLSQKKELERFKKRSALVESVWKSLDHLVRRMLKDPVLVKELEPQLKELRKAVEAVLTFDEKNNAKTS